MEIDRAKAGVHMPRKSRCDHLAVPFLLFPFLEEREREGVGFRGSERGGTRGDTEVR